MTKIYQITKILNMFKKLLIYEEYFDTIIWRIIIIGIKRNKNNKNKIRI